MFPGLGLYYPDPPQQLTTAGYIVDDLDRDLSDVNKVPRRDVVSLKYWGCRKLKRGDTGTLMSTV